MLTDSSHLWIGLIIFAASFFQSSIGFGFSLVAVPCLYVLKLQLPEAVLLSLVSSCMQRLISAHHHRHHFSWSELKPMILISLLALPIGFWGLLVLSNQTKSVVEISLGLMIILSVIIQRGVHIKSQETIHPAWGYAAAAGCGALCGLANVGGPPIILWIQAQRWNNEKMRVFTQALTLPMVPFQLLMFAVIFGSNFFNHIGYALCFVPFALIGGWLGNHFGGRLSVRRLSKIMTIVLLATGLLLIFKPS